MRVSIIQTLRSMGRYGVLGLRIAVLVIAGIIPALQNTSVEAAQLTSRKVTIETSEISTGSVGHTFDFSIGSGGLVEGIIYMFCTTPIGTCTKPSSMNVQTADHISQSSWADATAFTAHAVSNENDCTMSTNDYMMCFERTASTPEVAADAVQHVIDDITSPNAYGTVYIRISTYSDDDFQTADLKDQGTVASAYVRQLSVTGRVAERLEFCVGALLDGDNSGASGTDNTPTNCATGFPTETEVGLGVIDNSDTYVAPVDDAGTIANDRYGIAMVNTNASGGVAVTFFVETPTAVTASDTDQLRTFRVVPTDCSSTAGSIADQCFRAPAVDNTNTAFTNGSERFGMYIPCIDSRHDAITTVNLVAAAPYTGTDGAATEADEEEASTCQFDEAGTNMNFAWNTTSTPFEIASSTSSTEKVVDSEAIKISFGATASPTTPEGAYIAVLTYIATPTF